MILNIYEDAIFEKMASHVTATDNVAVTVKAAFRRNGKLDYEVDFRRD